MQCRWHTAQAERLGPRIQRKPEGTVRDVWLCLPGEGKVVAQALVCADYKNGNCHMAHHTLC